MGDRGNIAVHQSDGEIIYLYTHWNGSEVQDVTRRALAKRWRWDDVAYLTRIIFDELTEGQHGNETGFGISTDIPDNQHPIVHVIAGNPLDPIGIVVIDDTKWTFGEFIAQSPGRSKWE